MVSARWAAMLLVATLATGCVPEDSPADRPADRPVDRPVDRPADSPSVALSTSASTRPSATATRSTSATPPGRSPVHRERRPDPRWQFFTTDRRWYRSPWYAGAHRIMIGFGCTTAPWYSHDERCPGDRGFHHGIDVAMSCGTTLFAGLPADVLAPDAPGSPGSAYGVNPLRLRVDGSDGPYDVLLGHTREVFVRPGEQVRAGQRIALASDSAAPDGCHLHFEVRPAGGDVSAAVDPTPWFALEAD